MIYWMKRIYIVGIGIGLGTVNEYPPFDPSAWLAMFCFGGLWSCLEIEAKLKEKNNG
jgi:hypothetical protein